MNDPDYPNTLTPEEQRSHVDALVGRLQDALDWPYSVSVGVSYERGGDFTVDVTVPSSDGKTGVIVARYQILEELEAAVENAEQEPDAPETDGTVPLPCVPMSDDAEAIAAFEAYRAEHGRATIPSAPDTSADFHAGWNARAMSDDQPSPAAGIEAALRRGYRGATAAWLVVVQPADASPAYVLSSDNVDRPYALGLLAVGREAVRHGLDRFQ